MTEISIPLAKGEKGSKLIRYFSLQNRVRNFFLFFPSPLMSTDIFYFLLLYFLPVMVAYPGFKHKYCDYSNNYTANSTFSVNLAQALNNLPENTAPTGFNATTVSHQEEPVTALALCRPSLSPPECRTCVEAASVDIRGRRACPNQKTAQVWYTLCMVRYSTRNFINTVNVEIAVTDANVRDGPDPYSYSFNQSLLFLLQNLSSTAVETDKRSAVGRIALSQNLTIYGYVDCTRDLSGADCAKCFLSVTKATSQCCATRRSLWILTPSCSVQTNVKAVQTDWPNSPLIGGGALVAPEPGTPPAKRVSGGSRRNRLVVKVSVGMVVVTVTLGVCVLTWEFARRTRKRQRGRRNGENAEVMIMKREGIGLMRPFLYDLDQLVVATDNFSVSNRLGRGGFGTVYKVISTFMFRSPFHH